MRLSLDRLWLVIAIGLPVLVALLVPMPAVDLAYQVRAGDEILRTATLPGVDTWTFTVAGTTWTDQQWLAQVLLSLGFRAGGWELLAVVRAGLIAVVMGFTLASSMARGAGHRTAAVLALLAFALAAPALALRPQLFGIAIFAALLFLVATRERHPRRLWLAPLLIVLWANMHGSFVLAPLVLGYAWLDDVARGRPWRPTLAVLVVGVLATLVNPFGPAVWAYAAGIGANPAITERVSEWQRTTPLTVPGALFYASAIGVLIVLVRGRSALRWPDWLWVAGMFVIGAWTVRGLAWWPFAAAFVVAAALPVLLAPRSAAAAARSARPSPIAAVLAIVFGVAILARAAVVAAAGSADRPRGPADVRAVGARAGRARQRPSPATACSPPQTWASWFEWAAPAPSYFLDSRFELFPAPVWDDYDAITQGGHDAAEEALDRWGVNVIVLPADADPPPGVWATVYRDKEGSLLLRASPTLVPSEGPGSPIPSVMVAPQVRLDP